MSIATRGGLTVLFGMALAACASWPDPGPTPREPDTLPQWSDEDFAGMVEALALQCDSTRLPTYWDRLCASRPAENAGMRGWIAANFLAWVLQGDDGNPDGLLTGYHEPVLTGSRVRESASQVPLYAPPTPGSVIPPTRAEIDAGALGDEGIIVWVDDAIEAFFLQIQGSGRILLRDGSVLRLGFAGHNAQEYRSIGRELIDRGAMRAAQVDADSIRAWLRAHPDQAQSVMQANPRYVYFRVLDSIDPRLGPPGSLGVPLSAMRSFAVDPRRIRLGSIVYIAARPLAGDPRRARLTRIGLAQDTGAAIRGPVRADLFTGSSEYAATLAAGLRQDMRAWILLPRGMTPETD